MATIVSAPPRAAAAVEAPRLSRELVAGLRSPACYPHPAPDIQVIETHISFVVLAGDHAYKIKKPVALGSSISRPGGAALLLRRGAAPEPAHGPELYLEVVPIAGRRGTRGGRPGPAIEYAVRMRRFGQEALLDRIAREADSRPGRWKAGRPWRDSMARPPRARPRATSARRRACSPRRCDNFRDIEALETAETARVLGALRSGRYRARGAGADLRRAARRRLRARVPRRPAPRQHRAARRRAGALRLHRVRRAAALDRRDERGRVHS